MPDIVALGEPMAEFAAVDFGALDEVYTFRRGWGGDTSNVVVAAARLGASAGYITRVGDDAFGRSFLRLWAQEGVDASRVVVDREASTGVYFIARYAGGHSFTYYRAGSAASRLTPGDLDRDYLRRARVVHTSGITQAISPSARDTAAAAMEIARGAGVRVSYDLNLRPRLAPVPHLRTLVAEALPRADIVFLSEEDAGHLDDTRPAEAVAEDLCGRGPRLVILKRGAAGCLVITAGGERWAVPSWPVEVVDATGAGDAFDAGFLVEWLRGVPPPEAARLATAVGALTAAGLGAVAPLPTRAEVERFMVQHGDSRTKGGTR
ncbi:MAG: sugar kinase [Armatimonadota bacterium]|nr:sugar kinase [Armatimonadota bacterium]MDR7400888.1 sugar kinase [Armatimonadota bacterium]MDR7404175.1 sugar kinase [Armatimonadota bacterium]MDR7437394.1 sugar kinase [Armatimonadota bacterium]MDR7472790.1 sugar kinase [Armatimonadota bacterium]